MPPSIPPISLLSKQNKTTQNQPNQTKTKPTHQKKQKEYILFVYVFKILQMDFLQDKILIMISILIIISPQNKFILSLAFFVSYNYSPFSCFVCFFLSFFYFSSMCLEFICLLLINLHTAKNKSSFPFLWRR